MTSTIAIRTNANHELGLGHLHRCLALAHALNRLGATCTFITDTAVKTSADLSPFDVTSPTVNNDGTLNHQDTIELVDRIKPDALVIDGYDVTEEQFKSFPVPVIIAIDDTIERSLPIDLIINTAPFSSAPSYKVQHNTKMLLGPRYALIRDEFCHTSERVIKHRLERLLITVGGSDPDNITSQLLSLSINAIPNIKCEVVIGPFFKQDSVAQINSIARKSSLVTIHQGISNLASLMVSADLAISGGGQTTYELAATGTPTIGILFAENQTQNLDGLSKNGSLIWIGTKDDEDLVGKLKQLLITLNHEPDSRKELSQSGTRLIDGNGPKRVARKILQLCQ